MKTYDVFFMFVALLILLLCLPTRAHNYSDITNQIINITADSPIDSKIFIAMAHAESGFKPDNIGDLGKAHGLFQIHEGASRDVGFTGDIKDLLIAEYNIKVASLYLSLIYKKFNNNLWCAVSAFNKGMSNISYYDLQRQCLNHKYVKRVKYFLKATDI